MTKTLLAFCMVLLWSTSGYAKAAMRIFMLLLTLFVLPLYAQEDGKPQADVVNASELAPVLTQLQRLQLENAILTLRNTQLRLQLAQEDNARSALELQEVLKAMPKKKGWQLDLQKFTYVQITKPFDLKQTMEAGK